MGSGEPDAFKCTVCVSALHHRECAGSWAESCPTCNGNSIVKWVRPAPPGPDDEVITVDDQAASDANGEIPSPIIPAAAAVPDEEGTIHNDKATRDDQESTIYTLRAVYGDPLEPLPAWIKALKKGDIQRLLEERGYQPPFSGSKADLLAQISNELAFVEMRIDSGECLQRDLAVALSSWQMDLYHLYRVEILDAAPAPGARSSSARLMDTLTSWTRLPLQAMKMGRDV